LLKLVRRWIEKKEALSRARIEKHHNKPTVVNKTRVKSKRLQELT
jgi:hypothetical protein